MSLTYSTRDGFLSEIKGSACGGTPFAAAKFSVSDQLLMYYPIARKRIADGRQLAAYYAHLKHHGLNLSGVFPIEHGFLQEYSEFYAEHLRNIDCLGLHRLQMEEELLQYWNVDSTVTDFIDQEPDRETPANEDNCYLGNFSGKRVVVINPIAKLLCERGTEEIFNAVWAKTGKRWFSPSALIPVEIAYGVLPEVRESYGTVIQLFHEITARLSDLEYDMALIGAGGLGVPLASFVKQQGKFAISLGGHLQIVFGVHGQRWKEREEWVEKYFTGAWIDVPEECNPSRRDVCESAYW